ncbi:MAG: hypothetical protein V7604_4148 [Hyphomicrobiales bacterium]
MVRRRERRNRTREDKSNSERPHELMGDIAKLVVGETI